MPTLSPQFLRFCIVGSIAFAVDATVLELVIALDIAGVTVARGLSMAAAMQVAYILNRRFTFRHHKNSSLYIWARFVISNLAGAIINYGVFLAILNWLVTNGSSIDRITAIIAGTGVALFFNYWANQRFVFRGDTV